MTHEQTGYADFKRGYRAFRNGLAFDVAQSDDWQAGWETAQDHFVEYRHEGE